MKNKLTPRQILTPKVTLDMEKKYYGTFASQAKFIGKGIYHIPELRIQSTCTRELFLMYIAEKEQIQY